MEQNDNKDIEQALQDLEGSLGTTSVSNKVRSSAGIENFLFLVQTY